MTMKITVVFGQGVAQHERKAITNVMHTAKSEKEISKVTAELGVWMIVLPHYRKMIFWK
jgi:hypothetical protein